MYLLDIQQTCTFPYLYIHVLQLKPANQWTGGENLACSSPVPASFMLHGSPAKFYCRREHGLGGSLSKLDRVRAYREHSHDVLESFLEEEEEKEEEEEEGRANVLKGTSL